jgi:polar amino acid transport system substrate-binding protein
MIPRPPSRPLPWQSMRTLLGSLILGATALLAVPHTASSQASSGPPAASFTTAQADNGRNVFDLNCAGCHANDLTGGVGPTLLGAPFNYTWGGQQVAGLIKFVQNNMPASAPGTLEPEATLNVVAYILSMNKVAAGETPLSATSTAVVVIPRGGKR